MKGKILLLALLAGLILVSSCKADDAQVPPPFSIIDSSRYAKTADIYIGSDGLFYYRIGNHISNYGYKTEKQAVSEAKIYGKFQAVDDAMQYLFIKTYPLTD